MRAEDIFDLDDPRENNDFYRLANFLHINTRAETVRSLLLFKTGEKLSVRVIEETERLLRQRSFLYEASIRPIQWQDGVVDLEVKTRDTWSLDLSAGVSRAGGANSGHVSVKEQNFLGSGIGVGIGYNKDVDRKGTTFEVSNGNLFDRRGVLAIAHAENDDGHATQFSVARPFYELDARWAAGVNASDSDALESQYNAGNSIAEYRHKRRAADVFGGWSAGLSNGWVRRYSVGVATSEDIYALEPGHATPDRLPQDLTLNGPFVRFELLEDAYRKDVNVNLIGRIEDFNLGVQMAAQLERALAAWGSTRDSWIYSLSGTNGFDFAHDGFMTLGATYSGRYSDRSENQALGGGARAYYRSSARLLYYASLQADAVRNPDTPAPLSIGGDTGLRGYPLRYQAGERRVLATVEARGYTDWYPFRLFRVGGAVFYDTGRAWQGENQNVVAPGWLRDWGFGLRLMSARTSKGNVLHMDVAFPLDGDPSIKNAQFLVKTKAAF